MEDFGKKGGSPVRRKSPPEHVRRAIVRDDLEQLRASGRAGAAASNEAKAIKKDEREAIKEYFDGKLAAREYGDTIIASNQHIVPLDPDEKDAA